MSDLAGSTLLVQLESVTTTGPVSESMLQSIAALANYLRANATAVGDVIYSDLDESTFQSQRGTNWVLSDGRSVVGSQYQALTGLANVPDRRGRYLRMKDHGAGVDPAGDLAIGTNYTDTTGPHIHSLSNHAHPVNLNGAGAGALRAVSADIGGATFGVLVGSRSDFGDDIFAKLPNINVTGSSTGDPETRVKTTVTNVFVRIN